MSRVQHSNEIDSELTTVLDPLGKWPPGMQQNAIEFNGPVDLVGTAAMIAQMVGRVTTEARHL